MPVMNPASNTPKPGRRSTRRRSYGTGSLKQVGNSWIGTWYARDGRQVRRKVGDVRTPGRQDGLTVAQAERKFASMREADPPRRRKAGDARVTMKEAGDELGRTLERKGRKKSHRLTVASDLRNHIVPFFEGQALDAIDTDDVERYIDVKLRTLAVKTVRNHLNTMHSVFQIGLRKGWCRHNPVKLAERPVIKKTETRIRYLTQPEVDKLVAAKYPDDAWGSIEPTLYLTAAMTGLRQGELLGLRWRDVDFRARRIRVVSPYVRGEFADPKSEGSGRSVPMASRVAEALEQLHARTLYGHPTDLVLCHPETGKPLDRSKLVRRFKTAIEQAGVRRITFHELRHTFGTRMAAHGVPLRRLQEWMGHADAKTTQIYAHYQPAEDEAEVIDLAFA
jgi:integrase